MQEQFRKLVLKKLQETSKGTVMRNSSLAERLEEFAATVRVIDPPAKKSPVDHGEAANSERQAPRRLTLTTRSRQRPVTGMRQFRVF